jgi:hypothetical protein
VSIAASITSRAERSRDPALGALTAVLAVRVRAFGLLGEAEQERRLARWGQVLAGLARNQTPVRRVGILERTVPSNGDELQRATSSRRATARCRRRIQLRARTRRCSTPPAT